MKQIIIISEIDIKKDNKNIRIINSYEQYFRKFKNVKYEKEYENEKEIKNCEIRINDEIIPFSFFYKFNKKGKYNIKYIFKENISKCEYMFFGCENIAYIDLSNFNTNCVLICIICSITVQKINKYRFV